MPFKLLRSPSSTIDQSKNSRLSFNLFYFATGDTQKDSGLEVEFRIHARYWSFYLNHKLSNLLGNLSNSASNHGEKKHHTNKALFWPSCAYGWLCNNNIQLRPGWTIFFPLNRLHYRNENSEPPRHGLLSKASIWHPF